MNLTEVLDPRALPRHLPSPRHDRRSYTAYITHVVAMNSLLPLPSSYRRNQDNKHQPSDAPRMDMLDRFLLRARLQNPILTRPGGRAQPMRRSGSNRELLVVGSS